jgi:hypothetical protein
LNLATYFPPAGQLLDLEPEEVALPLLRVLWAHEKQGNQGQVHRHNFLISGSRDDGLRGYAGEHHDEVARRVTEAWIWLEREGLLAPRPDQGGEFLYVTRRGLKLVESASAKVFRAGTLLPREALDPRLYAKVVGPFLRGDFGDAVAGAFRDVEVRVRELGGIGNDVSGARDAMVKGFKAPSGTLVDPGQVPSEQEATLSLFIGAMGRFRNPSAHGDVGIDDPVECVELLMFANLLVRLAERGRAAAQAPGGARRAPVAP